MSAKIAAALHQVMQSVGYVQKTGKNAFHGYKYAGEADLLEKLRPAMVEAGLLLLPSVKDVSPPDQHGNVTVIVDYTIAHSSGDTWPTPITAVGCGNDMSVKTGKIGDKGVYKALTGANKYLLFKLFQIETGDDPERDDEPAPPPTPKPKAAARKEDYPALEAEIRRCETPDELRRWAQDNGARIGTLPEDWRTNLREEFEDHMARLRTMKPVVNVLAAG